MGFGGLGGSGGASASFPILIAGPGIELDRDPGPPQTITIKSTATGVSVGETPPASPAQGNLWFDSDTLRLYLWYEGPTSSQWVGVTIPSTASITVSATPPALPISGTLWFDINTLAMYIWYVGPTSSNWVGIK